MKKKIALLLVAAMTVASLVACGNSAEESAPAAEEAAPAAEESASSEETPAAEDSAPAAAGDYQRLF